MKKSTFIQDIAIDCESLGTAFDAPILAIGAVLFERDTGKVHRSFYQEIEFRSAAKCGTIDGDTIAWWISQGDTARALFEQGGENKMALSTALVSFRDWFRECYSYEGAPQPWGNGATADITWLEHAYARGAVGLYPPWNFRKIRDMRTIVEAAKYLVDFDVYKAIPQIGTKHHALDDATWQAQAISACFNAIRERLDDGEI